MKLIQVTEAAERLGVSRQTLENWGKKGIINIRKIGKNGNSHWVDGDTIEALGDTMLDVEQARLRLEKECKDIEDMSMKTKEMYYDIRHELRLVGIASTRYFAKDFCRSMIAMFFDIGILNMREKEFLTAFIDGRDIKHIAEEYCLSNTRISQILFRTCNKIRNASLIKEKLDELEKLREQNKIYKRTIDYLEKEIKEIKTMETHEHVQESTIKLLETRLQDCDLSVRALNCLRAADIDTIGELVVNKEKDLLKFRNFGRKSLWELGEFLESKGLTWEMDVDKIYRDYIVQSRTSTNNE